MFVVGVVVVDAGVGFASVLSATVVVVVGIFVWDCSCCSCSIGGVFTFTFVVEVVGVVGGVAVVVFSVTASRVVVACIVCDVLVVVVGIDVGVWQ